VQAVQVPAQRVVIEARCLSAFPNQPIQVLPRCPLLNMHERLPAAEHVEHQELHRFSDGCQTLRVNRYHLIDRFFQLQVVHNPAEQVQVARRVNLLDGNHGVGSSFASC